MTTEPETWTPTIEQIVTTIVGPFLEVLEDLHNLTNTGSELDFPVWRGEQIDEARNVLALMDRTADLMATAVVAHVGYARQAEAFTTARSLVEIVLNSDRLRHTIDQRELLGNAPIEALDAQIAAMRRDAGTS